MASYIVPQVLISQLISEVSLNTTQNQNVLVIGPNYALFRYSDAAEKPKTYIGEYDGSAVRINGEDAATITGSDFDGSRLPVDFGTVEGAIPYPGQPAGSVPDEAYARLFGDNVVVALLETKGFDRLDDESYSDKFDGRIRFSFAIAGKYRGHETDYRPGNPSEETPASITVLDDVIADVKRDIVAGDVIRIPGVGSSDETFESIVSSVFESVEGSGVFDCVRLEDTIPDDVDKDTADVEFCAMFNGVEISRKQTTPGMWNWTTYSDPDDGEYGIVVDTDMTVVYNNWGDQPIETKILEADLYLTYRALLPQAASDIQSVESHTYVESLLGTVHPDNPLAFGTYMAAINSGDRLVYYCGVPSDDLSGYNSALNKATLTDQVYFIVPLSRDETVIDSVREHVEEMSSKENKLWRIGFVSQEPPTTDTIYDAIANVDGKPFYAKFMQDKNGSYTMMQFMWDEKEEDTRPSSVTKCMTQVEAGDVVKVFTGNPEDTWDDTPNYTEYAVKKVVSNTVLQLNRQVDIEPSDDAGDDYDGSATGLCCGPDHHYEVEVYRKLGHARQAKYIADLSSSLATRRMYNVFPSMASTDGVQYSGEFLAAAAAGLASSVLPQQPITNVELNGIGDVPLAYQTFSRAELNTIAAGGTFIVMQDRPGSQVYVRHQISTAYSEGNLLKAELSITKNLDSISYYFAALFAPLIGKYNITPEILDVIRSRLNGGLAALENDTGAGLYGPQVLEEGTEIVYLRQSEVNKDHVEARVHLNLPVPFNYFDLDLEI